MVIVSSPYAKNRAFLHCCLLISVSEATDATIDLGQVELHRCGVERWRANGWPSAAFEQFAHTFAQTLPEAEKRPAYDRYMVPTPGRIFYQRVPPDH
jgi:hypothetical protein